MTNESFFAELSDCAGTSGVLKDEPLSRHTSFRIGGPADFFVCPGSPEELRNILRTARSADVPVFVMGNGSNLLVSDAGFRGLVVQIGRGMDHITAEGQTIRAEAGALLGALSRRALKEGYTGLEFAGGIPGSVGGACVMNAGAYDGEMKNVLRSVTVLDEQLELRDIPKEELELSYRSSIFQKKHWIAVEARVDLQSGDPAGIRDKMEEFRRRRTARQPLDLPSAGSTFKRPEGYFAGKLIMDAGLRGYRVGGASVSVKHCGFVVNDRNATASDVRKLIEDVRREVFNRFGVQLEPEVKFLGEF